MNELSSVEEVIFSEALDQPPAERRRYIESRCARDSLLLERVLALLRGYEENSAYLEATPCLGQDASFRQFASKLPRDHAPGESIGNYRLVERIGVGGCGVVYLAEQQEPVRRRVALKVVKLGMDTLEFIARFEAERQALAMMDHANIARVFDAGATPTGRPYFAMEYVPGLPLTHYCDRHRLGTNQRLELFMVVCHAIQHAHQKGIIHRDLKPSNILVTEDDGKPVPKVIDFGIAKALHGPLTDKTLLTHIQSFVGTPAYTSPEQSEQGALDVDTRSDIYSLGVLLYELLTGQQPFDRLILERASLEETRRLIREVEAPSPSARLSSLTAEQRIVVAERRSIQPGQLSFLLRYDLDWIVMRCLEKDRERRYETANALALDLQRYLKNEPVVARPPSRSYRLRKFFQRNKAGAMAATAVLASLVAGLVTAGVLLVREKSARERASTAERAEATLRRQAESAQKNETQRASRAIIHLANERLAQGRAAEGLAFLASAAQKDPTDPTIAPRLAYVLASRNFLLPDGLLARHPAPAVAIDYSDDGSRLVAVWDDGTLGRIDLASGKVEKERLSETSHTGYTRMKTRGYLLVYSPDGLIRPIDLQTGKVTREIRFDFDTMGCRAVAESSDVFVTKLTSNTMMLCDAAGGQMIGRPIFYPAYLGEGPKWVAWSDEGTGAPTHRIRFRRTDIENSEVTLTFPIEIAHGKLATSPDGQRLATVQREGPNNAYFLRLWSLPDGAPAAEPRKLDRLAWAFYSPDGRFVICWGNGLEVFNAENGARVTRMTTAGPFVDETRYAFSPNGRILTTWGNAGVVDLWDLETGLPHVAPLRHGGNVTHVSFCRNGKALLTTSDGLARVWNVDTGELLAEPTLQIRGVPAVALSPDGSQLIVGTSEGELYRFRLGRGSLEPLVLARTGELPTPFLPGTPTRFLWMTRDRARVIQVSTGRDAGSSIDYPEAISRAAMRDDGKVLVVQTSTGEWRSWWRDERGLQSAVPISEASTEIGGATFSQTNDLAVLSWPTKMRAWNLRTGKPVGPLIATTSTSGAHRFASLSPDGKRLLRGSGQGHARVWDTATGQELVDFGRQPTNILFAAYSPDGSRIVSGNKRGWTQLWDGLTGRPIGPILEHPGMWGKGTFSPDNRLLAAYGEGGLLRLQDTQADGTVQQSPRLSIGARTPTWLIDLATLCAGKRLSADGLLTDVPEASGKIETLRRQIEALPDQSPYLEWGRWFLSNRETRSIAPGFEIEAKSPTSEGEPNHEKS